MISPRFIKNPTNVAVLYVLLVSMSFDGGNQPRSTANILTTIAAKKYVGREIPIIVKTVTV